jgi:hypothetical protein
MMTTPVLTETATVRDLLFGGLPVAPTDALAESLREHGTVRTLVTRFPGVTALAEREVATETNGLLSLDLFHLVMAGWKKYEALIQAARRTRAAPNTEETVALATHQVKSTYQSTVEVFIDGTSVGTLEVEVSVAFDIAGARAVIRQARLTAIKAGRCTVTGTLAIKGIDVAKRQRQFDLPGAVQLRHGVALLEPTPGATPVEQAVAAHAHSTSAPARWCPDPTRRYELRWWDGSRWTNRVSTHRREMSDPVAAERVPTP